MPLILNIDTSIDTASVCLAKNNELLLLESNENQKDHAAWLQNAIANMMKAAGFTLNNLDAVAVTNGPGSYTGLRVGLSTAKGLCYALQIPLITIGTLELMAFAAKNEKVDLLCPMIDARRMEVFTAIYNKQLFEIEKPHARVLDEHTFEAYIINNQILFFGNGSLKFQPLVPTKQAVFKAINFDAATMLFLSHQRFENEQFADLAYAEPFYIKDFHAASRNITTR